MTKLPPHHLAWLAAHPSRDELWLLARIADGFHVHHIDGDRGNNDFKNLVLIEGADHLALHGMDCRAGNRPNLIRFLEKKPRTGRLGPRKKTLKKREMAYLLIVNGGLHPATPENIRGPAKIHAEQNNLPWPPEAGTTL